jgi:hypothetical protein
MAAIEPPKIRVAIRNFFDKEAVIARLPPATRKAMSKAGAYIRSDAIRAISRYGEKKQKVSVVDEKKRPILVRGKRKTVQLKIKASSKPGEPPRSQTGQLKKFIYSSYDQNTNSVVIGPSALNKPGKAPRVLEYGGTTTMMIRYRQVDDDTVMKLSKPIKAKVKIEKRPYMGPALERNMSVVAEVWKNAIT